MRSNHAVNPPVLASLIATLTFLLIGHCSGCAAPDMSSLAGLVAHRTAVLARHRFANDRPLLLNPACLGNVLPDFERQVRSALETDGVPYRTIGGVRETPSAKCRGDDPGYIGINVTGLWTRRRVEIWFDRGMMCAGGEAIDAVWDDDKWLPEHHSLVSYHGPSSFPFHPPVLRVTALAA